MLGCPRGVKYPGGPSPWVPSVFWSPSTEVGQAGPRRRVAFSVRPQGGSVTPQKGAQAGVPERRGPSCSRNPPACRDTPTLVQGGQRERGLRGSLGQSHFTGGLSLPIHYLGALTALKVCVGGPQPCPCPAASSTRTSNDHTAPFGGGQLALHVHFACVRLSGGHHTWDN